MWFVARKETEYGPYSAEQLKRLAEQGKLRPNDEVRAHDSSNYAPAHSIDWLFPAVVETEQPILVPDDGPASHVLDEDAVTEEMGPLSRRGIKVRPHLTLTYGDFQILRKLGAGGMGAVYLAYQRSQNRRVAIKMLSAHLADKVSYIHRFYREAMVLSQLQHPNIVRFYGIGENKGTPFFAMEYVNGHNTAWLLRKFGRFSISDALHILVRCAEAIGHGHAHNIIHRDIKPGNILITHARVVKIADLGLAKPMDEDLDVTDSGVSMGTPKYMAPEQSLNAKNADHRSDLYSLGAVLYHFLSGESPFKGETSMEVQKAKEQGSFAPLRRLNSEVPPRLDLIIDRLLAKEPRYRYQSCKELIQDIEGLGLHKRRLSFDMDDLRADSIEPPLTPIRENLIEILLVNENNGDIRLAQQALEENCIAANLNVAKDGLEALNFLRREGTFQFAPRPHLIIFGADLQAPASLAVLDELRSQPALSDIPLIVLTRSSQTREFLTRHGFSINLTVSSADDLNQLDNLIDSVKGMCLTVVQCEDNRATAS